MPEEECCHWCRFWGRPSDARRGDADNFAQRFCRRFPPTTPACTTKAHEWCGEFQRIGEQREER